jgi:hypothetical protein
MTPARWAATAFATLLLFVGRDARAFCRTTACDPKVDACEKDEKGCPRSGPPLSWRALPLPYRFHAPGSAKLDNDGVRAVVRRAFQTWSNVTCNGKRTSLAFVEQEDIPGKEPLATSTVATVAFGIYFRDTVWPYTDTEQTLALTNVVYGKKNGYIDFADIELNLTERRFAVSDTEQGVDLQSVFTHEVGHYIGLAHSRVEGSMMAPSYCQNANGTDRCGTSTDLSRALGDDDVDALCALYPSSGIAGVTYAPPNSACSVSSGATMTEPGASGVAAAAALTLLAAACRWRRRS